ncbi:hypothetical protein CYMTET_29521 [Cymbomonas tetramitiformis]|uniref:Uncharacterized protein n=1 Tax=Cymbomonas tetramitiformis TaxID=36881 RepID=A0AAE0FMA9_9CHLO|nr:hypothetical protein CYMTET_29521 [Cymbomonas tetramitiformis]
MELGVSLYYEGAPELTCVRYISEGGLAALPFNHSIYDWDQQVDFDLLIWSSSSPAEALSWVFRVGTLTTRLQAELCGFHIGITILHMDVELRADPSQKVNTEVDLQFAVSVLSLGSALALALEIHRYCARRNILSQLFDEHFGTFQDGHRTQLYHGQPHGRPGLYTWSLFMGAEVNGFRHTPPGSLHVWEPKKTTGLKDMFSGFTVGTKPKKSMRKLKVVPPASISQRTSAALTRSSIMIRNFGDALLAKPSQTKAGKSHSSKAKSKNKGKSTFGPVTEAYSALADVDLRAVEEPHSPMGPGPDVGMPDGAGNSKLCAAEGNQVEYSDSTEVADLPDGGDAVERKRLGGRPQGLRAAACCQASHDLFQVDVGSLTRAGPVDEDPVDEVALTGGPGPVTEAKYYVELVQCLTHSPQPPTPNLPVQGIYYCNGGGILCRADVALSAFPPSSFVTATS